MKPEAPRPPAVLQTVARRRESVRFPEPRFACSVRRFPDGAGVGCPVTVALSITWRGAFPQRTAAQQFKAPREICSVEAAPAAGRPRAQHNSEGKGLSKNNLYTSVILSEAKNLTARPFALLRVTITRGNIRKPNREVYILTGPNLMAGRMAGRD